MEILRDIFDQQFWIYMIYIGLLIVYLKQVKTYDEIQSLKQECSRKRAEKPTDEFTNNMMQDAYHSGFRQGYAEAVDDLSGDSTRKSDDESPKVS